MSFSIFANKYCFMQPSGIIFLHVILVKYYSPLRMDKFFHDKVCTHVIWTALEQAKQGTFLRCRLWIAKQKPLPVSSASCVTNR